MIGPNRRALIAAAPWIANGPHIGSARVDDVQVNTYTAGIQSDPSVGLDADGDFVVVWRSDGSSGTDSSSSSIQSQRYAADGSPVAAEFQVNAYTTFVQFSPAVALSADGSFVVAWTSGGSGGTATSSTSIQKTVVAPIFADGFESGDTGAWSSTTTP